MNVIELKNYSIEYHDDTIKITKDYTIYQTFIDDTNANKILIYRLLENYQKIHTISLDIIEKESYLELQIQNNDNLHNDDISLYLFIVEENIESKVELLNKKIRILETELNEYKTMLMDVINIDIPITNFVLYNLSQKIKIIELDQFDCDEFNIIEYDMVNNRCLPIKNDQFALWEFSENNFNKLKISHLVINAYDRLPVDRINPYIKKLSFRNFKENMRVKNSILESVKNHKNLAVIKFDVIECYDLSSIHEWIPKNIRIEYSNRSVVIANQVNYLTSQGYMVKLV